MLLLSGLKKALIILFIKIGIVYYQQADTHKNRKHEIIQFTTTAIHTSLVYKKSDFPQLYIEIRNNKKCLISNVYYTGYAIMVQKISNYMHTIYISVVWRSLPYNIQADNSRNVSKL